MYTLGTGHKIAKNHAICDGPHIVAVVKGAGYPAGEGWHPRTEALAKFICDAMNEKAAREQVES